MLSAAMDVGVDDRELRHGPFSVLVVLAAIRAGIDGLVASDMDRTRTGALWSTLPQSYVTPLLGCFDTRIRFS
jgi:hypothetical protein